MTHTMLKVAIDNICKIIKGRVLINNKLSLLSIIKMRIIIMVTITIISDRSSLGSWERIVPVQGNYRMRPALPHSTLIIPAEQFENCSAFLLHESVRNIFLI